ncbi:NAD-dependent epimerase/dehydratase family protein [Sphaerochaeta halotolerans]|uniref:dTDP-4-dehydrorhamnose reductase n=1 Tax=Sphaerochaeta halotolerans TaxID=2293840 RepID=A0A372MDD7_9SPIR|nr:sugar nucleotide-binding protein [Sphaerochaeta halotolerans]RFU93815.1 NAD-dependent epimerase/dehydratase family protein [Sphaerochaeta halotolerans]
MRFLILGCNGMAGHTISQYMQHQGHDVLGFDRNLSPLVKSIAGDATDTDILRKLIASGNFDAIINCIGILNQFAEERKSLAVFLNSYLPHFLADVTAELDTQVIHMSTDCVFSGERGGYTEQDLRDGTTFYDRTKALGELEDGKNLTLRNSIVGPDTNPQGIGLFNWFMQQEGPISGYSRAMWTGQTTLQLAKTMEQAAKERISGLINAVPDEPISKYDLLMLFNKYFRGGSVEIIPNADFVADKSLKRTRFEFSYRIPDYERMVYELYKWVMAHSELYPHYHQ